MPGHLSHERHRMLPNTPVQIAAPSEYFRQPRQLPMENGGMFKFETLLSTLPVRHPSPHRKVSADVVMQDRMTPRDSSTVYQERNSLQPSPRLEPKSPHSPLNPKITTPPSSQSPQLVASKRLNFQRCRQLNATMGHESSRPSSKNSRPMFSGSFDSSVKKRVNPLPARTDSTASDDAAQEMSGLGESFGLTASAGSIQNTANGANGKRLLSEKKTNGKPLRPTRKSQQMGISTSAQVIINFCVENAKGDIASRVVNRMASKRDDFNLFIAGLSGEQWAEFVNSLRNYFLSIVQHLHSLDKIRELSVQYGVEQVQRRVWGFKADYFSLMASSLTTECVFLDGAQHSTTETIEAWAELAEVMFSSIRDGYYQKIRHMRKSSNCFHSMFSQSSEISSEEAAAAAAQR